MKIPFNITFGFILLIFFFNRLLLPYGLQYSLLLTPIFLYLLHLQSKTSTLNVPAILFFVYSLIHLSIGVVLKDFIVSSILMFSLFIFIAVFYEFYKKNNYIDFLAAKLTQFNFALTCLAIISLASGYLVTTFWYLEPFTVGYKIIPRLKLFELEASHYSFALLPLFFYFLWKVFREFDKKSFLLLLSLLLSLVLSFSLGVLAVIFVSTILTTIFYLPKILTTKAMSQKLFTSIFIFIISMSILYFYFPENPLFFRIKGVFTGNDTSGRGRTYESFEIVWQVLEQNNKYFGIGLGQFKIIGRQTLINYYKYMTIPEVVRIPNVMAETLLIYGIFGFIGKLLLQIFLFIKFKVKDNIFQLSLFTSLFVYQFTGSFLFNGLEYIFWIIAIHPKLPSFNKLNYFKA